MNKLLFITLFFFFGTGLKAQDFPPKMSHLVRIESSPEGAEVYQGDTLLGTTPLKVDGRNLNRMKAYFPSRNSWDATVRNLPESAPSYLEGVLFLEFPDQYSIRTVPSDAAVYHQGKLIGRTPLKISTRRAEDTILISKPGFAQQRVVLHEHDSEQINLFLNPLADFVTSGEVRNSKPSFRLPPTGILLAGTIGLVAGVTAVMLKEQADMQYERYTELGLASGLDSSRRYDLYSGIALAILELSIAYLLFELFNNS